MKKVYIAGPQVFLPDPIGFYEMVQKLCQQQGLEALIPFDPNLPFDGDVIYNSNMKLLREADAAVAYADPFRGAEPDSGTMWEVGFLRALDKPVFLYGSDDRTVEQKHRGYFAELSDHGKQFTLTAGNQGTVLGDGMITETFGHSHNLMLAKSCMYVPRGIHSAIEAVSQHFHKGTSHGCHES